MGTRTEEYLSKPIVIQNELLQFFSPSEKIVILDIGACEGLDSIKYAKLFPKADVFAFEPLPDNAQKIEENIIKYKVENVHIVREALSEQKGTATFYVSSGHPSHLEKSEDWDYGNKSSSLLPPDKAGKEVHKWLKFDQKIEVPTNTLANFCDQNGINAIDFIHLDVQGAELMVLLGAGDYLSQVTAIWMEVEKISLYKGQPLKAKVERFMKKRGFEKVVDTVDKVSGDQLYVNRKTTEVTKKNRQEKILSRLKKGLNFLNPLVSINGLRKNSDPKLLQIGKFSLGIPQEVAWAYKSGDYYETNVIFWLTKTIEQVQDPVFYDIGANYGYYTVTLASKCKKVYAFEPVGSVYDILSKNVKNNKLAHVEPRNHGIADENIRKEINIYSSSGNNSLFERKIPKGHSLQFLKKENITLKRLDDIIVQENLFPPSLIKIDVEGAELLVLQSVRKTLETCRPTVVVEYSKNTSEDAGYEREKILAILRDVRGYFIYGLSEDYEDTALIDLADFEKKPIANIIASPIPLK